jgi:hypothetical protein
VKRLLFLVFLLFASAWPTSALAAPRDASLQKKIDEALTTHYLSTHFDRAEQTITDEIQACRNRCSPRVVAKAWMYVGIIRGSGKEDQAGAKEAFVTAVRLDPNVALDDALASPPTKKSFAAAASGKRGKKPSGGGESKMVCSLAASEVQTRRPIPIACNASEEASKVELRYSINDSKKWVRVKMKKRDGRFQATIPCTATARPGALRYYVRAQDSEGAAVDNLADKDDPLEIELVTDTDEEAPALPDEDPPKRCSRAAAAKGAPVGEEDEEEEEPPQECIDSDECTNGGACVDGFCKKPEKTTSSSGPARANWVGMHAAMDLAIVGGEDVCSRESQRDKGFVCFYEGTEEQYLFNTQPGVDNNIKTGFALSTFRLLISYDRLIGDNVTVGGRLGYAFGGGPPSGEDQQVKFLPFHAELRASYWFGTQPFTREGLRPFVGASAGAAQVDAKLGVTVGDCGGAPDGSSASSPGATLPKDQQFSVNCGRGQLGAGQRAARLKLDAYKKLGKGFAGLHAGTMFAITKDSGILFNVNFMYLLPTTGQVIEPSIGYVFGI